MSTKKPFTKKNLDKYLLDLSKEYRRRSHGVPAEMIIIGGASILINYGFRDMTYDIDAVYNASSVMKESINAIEDKYGLNRGWLNNDFVKTSSYTNKIFEVSEYYRTFSNVLQIRTVKAEYLVAMKLVSGRMYKKDMSDIIGILQEQKENGKPLNYEMIDSAMVKMYNGWDRVSDASREFITNALKMDDYSLEYQKVYENEQAVREEIEIFTKENPNQLNEDNINDIIEIALSKKENAQIVDDNDKLPNEQFEYSFEKDDDYDDENYQSQDEDDQSQDEDDDFEMDMTF